MKQNGTKFDRDTGIAAKSGQTPERAKALETLPNPPDWLQNEALEEWYRIGPDLISRRVLTSESVTLFAHYCAINEQMIIALLAGKPNAALMSLFRLICGDLLITPMSQAKLPATKAPDKPANKFGQLTAVK